jgi:hypothetical protein
MTHPKAPPSNFFMAFGTLIAQEGHPPNGRNPLMQNAAFYVPLKIASQLILVLMAAAIVYGGYISLHYWSGIGV